MTIVQLGQLFDCAKGAGALIARASDGALVHIDDVPSGLACGCYCVGCERRMVAKKGEVQAHHFAHQSARDGNSCLSAGETALHKFAKEVLNERLEIAIPEMFVSAAEDRELVAPATTIKFENARLEVRNGMIVPDVVLELRDRRLLVEFKVTHASDETKIDQIREMNVGAVEVDLSQYRDRPLKEIGDDILYNAPRIWLHNPREDAARARLEQRVRQRAADFQREVASLQAIYRHRWPVNGERDGSNATAIRQNGLCEAVNLAVDGAGCFLVPVVEWQTAVALDLIASQKPFRTRNGLNGLLRRGWVDRRFTSLRDDHARALKDAGLPFALPGKAVELYLRKLKKLGLLHCGATETWTTTSLLRSKLEAAKELRERPAKRRAQIENIVRDQIGDLPESETDSFDFDAWIASPLADRQGSVEDAIQGEEAAWTAPCHDFSHIRPNIRFSPRSNLHLFGLPCVGELGRMLKQKADEAEQRETAKRQREQAEAEVRLRLLTERAVHYLGDTASIWLNARNVALNGLTPFEAASSSTGLDAAIEALNRKARELELAYQALQRKQKAVAELEKQAMSRYYDPELAALWMRSSRPELGGKSPLEFTCDEATRNRCAEYLPKRRSRR
ncbi:MAG: antitoxin Xre/MbcA/ParS toxin-binding domain-containing protein [Bradyrhizobium sp.]|nr:antitoxin Xre/MbcA/ParS toxin-binding domain-containing protein [Bradyrhizobium sp.]